MRTVYSYRTAKRIMSAIFWFFAGPLMILGSAIHIAKPSPSVLYVDTVWAWFSLVIFASMYFSEMRKALQTFFERIVIDGNQVLYYNRIGIKRYAINLEDIKEIDLVRGPRWNVFTPLGRFSFDDGLRNYTNLVEQFRSAGTAINIFPVRL